MHRFNLKDLSKSKIHSGMGFRNLVSFNKALLAKQVWRIINDPSSLVACIFKAGYFRFFDVMSCPISSNASFRRSLCWSRELLDKGLR